jgi:hypothetical protein
MFDVSYHLEDKLNNYWIMVRRKYCMMRDKAYIIENSRHRKNLVDKDMS